MFAMFLILISIIIISLMILGLFKVQVDRRVEKDMWGATWHAFIYAVLGTVIGMASVSTVWLVVYPLGILYISALIALFVPALFYGYMAGAALWWHAKLRYSRA